MSIHFSFQDDDLSIPEKACTEFFASIFSRENKEVTDVGIVFCTDEYLLRLNRSYLNHNYVTDVLSFPYESEPIEGEIYVSVDRVAENSTVWTTPFARELLRVMIHGVLHLCGYTDNSEGEKKEMTALEDKYLAQVPDRIFNFITQKNQRI